MAARLQVEERTDRGVLLAAAHMTGCSMDGCSMPYCRDTMGVPPLDDGCRATKVLGLIRSWIIAVLLRRGGRHGRVFTDGGVGLRRAPPRGGCRLDRPSSLPLPFWLAALRPVPAMLSESAPAVKLQELAGELERGVQAGACQVQPAVSAAVASEADLRDSGAAVGQAQLAIHPRDPEGGEPALALDKSFGFSEHFFAKYEPEPPLDIQQRPPTSLSLRRLWIWMRARIREAAAAVTTAHQHHK